MVRLTTIGSLAIDIGETRLTPVSQQAFAALLYFAVERGKEVRRKTLIELFCPDSAEADANHALRQLVYRLKKIGAPLDGATGTVLLARDVVGWDVDAIEARGHCTPDEVDALSAGYLAAYAPRISPAFDAWIDDHRSRVTTTLRRLLVAQLRDEKAKHRFAFVGKIARACLALDPFNEEATLATAEALVIGGSKTEALSVLDRYIDEVGGRSRDLKLAPAQLRERISEYVADRGLNADLPLIGRDEEFASIRSLMSRVRRGAGEACVVWGPSGIGKTRLLNEACAIAALDGFSIIRCGLQPHDQRRPLSVLRNTAAQLLDMPGALGCSPESLSLMRGLAGRGSTIERRLPTSSQDSQAALAETLAAASDLIDAVSAERPTLLSVENTHWIDEASLEFLVTSVAGVRSLCVLMASQRPLELPEHLMDASRISSIELPPLRTESSAELLHRMFQMSGHDIDEDFLEWSIALADGVPFYLQALFMENIASGVRVTVPSSLTASLASRIERLGEPSRSVLDAIVVLGNNCTLPRLERLVQLPMHELLKAMRMLEERGLIRTMRGNVVCFHDLFATTVRTRMPTSVARILHKAVAEMLETDDSEVPVAQWDIAVHWDSSGNATRGLSVLRRCAEEALVVGRPQEAIEILERATGLANSDESRRTIQVELFGACRAAGEWRKAESIVRELLDRDRDAKAEIQAALAVDWTEAAYRAGLPFAGHESVLESTAFDRSLSPVFRAKAAKFLLLAAENHSDGIRAETALKSIADLSDSDGDALLLRLIYQSSFGEATQAMAIADQMALIASDIQTHVVRQRLFFAAGFAHLRGGDAPKAKEYLLQSYAAAENGKLWTDCAGTSALLSSVEFHTGHIVQSKGWFARSEEFLGKGSFPNGGAPLHALGILISLGEGRVEDAEGYLLRARALYPKVLTNQWSLDHLAFELRIAIARGAELGKDSVEALVAGHIKQRAGGMQDAIADTALRALSLTGQWDRAELLRLEYLSRWRRESFPPSPAFQALHSDLGRDRLRAADLLIPPEQR